MNITVENMMKARDCRLVIQTQLIERFHLPLICLTMNIPGPIKTSESIKKCFNEGICLLKKQLLSENLEIFYQIIIFEDTGYEYFASINANAIELKKITIALENTNLIGRLFDFDVIDISHHKINREEIGYPSRTCILCHKPAFICARNRTHALKDMLFVINKNIKTYFIQQFIDNVSCYAINAMLTEVSISPKPGLIDRYDNGSHQDMNFFTFINSASIMYPYFQQFISLGIQSNNITKKSVIELKSIGRNCEQKMFSVTNQVNTHKGAIFSLGCFLFCIGYNYPSLKIESLGNTLKNLSSIFDFSSSSKTNGSILHKHKKSLGIRGELSSGYNTVFSLAYPTLCRYINLTLNFNDACALTLLHIIVNTDDSNIISRSNFHTAVKIKQMIKNDINSLSHQDLLSKIPHYNKTFIKLNISPGGSADILCVTIFLYYIFHS